MKKKGLLGAVSALAVLTGVYVLISQIDTTEQETEDYSEQNTISQTVTEEEVKEIMLSSETREMVFVREEELWTYPNQAEIPLNEELISDHISSVLNLAPQRVLKEHGELEEYGLEAPSFSVRMTKSDDTAVTYLFGDENQSTGDRYMLVEGEDTVYTVYGSIWDDLQFSVYDVARMEELPAIDGDSITKLVVKKDGADDVTFSLDEITGITWRMMSGEGVECTVDSTQMNSLLTTVSGLTYNHMADEQSDNRAEYGLDENAAEIIITYEETVEIESDTEEDTETEEGTETEEDTETKEDSETEEGTDTEEKTEINEETAEETESETETEPVTIVEEREFILRVGSTDASGDYYVQGNGNTAIYTMDAASLETVLELSETDYADKTIHTISLTAMDSLEISYQGKTRELYYTEETVTVGADEEEADAEQEASDVETENETEEETEEETEIVTHYYADNAEVESSQFQIFVNKLSALKAQTRIETVDDLSDTAEPVLELKIHKTDGSEAVYRYYSGDNGLYTVVPESGYPARVSKKSVDEILEEYEKLTVSEPQNQKG